MTVESLKELNRKNREWLTKSVLPLWTREGFDAERGEFEESLTLEGCPSGEPRRAMVQARQIYSFKIAHQIGLLPIEEVRLLIVASADNLIVNYQQPCGGYIHSRKVDESVNDARLDLYTQSFAIFGMAHAYELTCDARYLESARRVLEYIRRERHLTEGGYSELSSSSEVQFASNPHMHLFEAALAWMDLETQLSESQSGMWREFADELQQLACGKFVDAETGSLAENFASGWSINRDDRGRFMFEPGHQFEWAWLLARYGKLVGRDFSAVCDSLYDSGNAGVDRETGFTYDQMWSDLQTKERSSRFWPQAERVKAAAFRSMETTDSVLSTRAATDAGNAMASLRTYFQTPYAGLWFDFKNAEGVYKSQNAKGSSLYHIIGAIAELDALVSRLPK